MKATGDVCEHCRWQRKRAKRSGSGRNLAKRTASEKNFGHRNSYCTPYRGMRYNNTKDLHSKSGVNSLRFIFFAKV